ncbi:hypothetical protein PO909_020793 [Leuciscus waleckii]
MGDQRIIVMASQPGNQSLWAPHSSSTPQLVEPPVERAGPSVMDRPAVTFRAPPVDTMPIAESEGELASGDDDSAALSPSGRVTLPEPDPEMSAMLKRAVKAVGLVWNPPPCPEQSRLDDWFLRAGRAGSQPAASVTFFPEVYGELSRSWTAPFSTRNCLSSSSPLTTLDGGAVCRDTAGSWVQFKDPVKRLLTHLPADPWRQVSVALHTQTPLRAAPRPSELGPCPPPRCSTPGTSVVPLVPGPVHRSLKCSQPVQLAPPYQQTRLTIQFGRRPPSQRYLLHFGVERMCPWQARGHHSPTGEGCD